MSGVSLAAYRLRKKYAGPTRARGRSPMKPNQSVSRRVYEVVNANNKVDAYDVTITIKEAPRGSSPNTDKPL